MLRRNKRDSEGQKQSGGLQEDVESQLHADVHEKEWYEELRDTVHLFMHRLVAFGGFGERHPCEKGADDCRHADVRSGNR